MILTQLRTVIDRASDYLSREDALQYCQGYIDGVRKAPLYGLLSEGDWRRLNNYITKKFIVKDRGEKNELNGTK